MNLRKLQDVVEDKGAWCATVHGVGHDLGTEQLQIHIEFDGQGLSCLNILQGYAFVPASMSLHFCLVPSY